MSETRFQAPRGTHYGLPGDANWWGLVRVLEDVTALYGWSRIQTPGFEDTTLFERTSGAASDVVHKEMYTFKDRSDRPLTLRPEGTAPICRAYIEHGMHREPQPVKAYTIAPMYRYTAPGKGRYREHWQLHLNSIGDANCRPQYVERLNAWLDAHADILDEDARHKRATSPLQVFDVKNPALLEALEDAPKIGESLCASCREHFEEVQRHLDLFGVPYVLDPTLVRGLDYYSRTTFEFLAPFDNANSSICGGGRYDGLVEAIGG